MDLIIDNKIIDTPMLTIINQVKNELLNGKLKNIRNKKRYLLVTCPHHGGGVEDHPSCGVCADPDDPNLMYGVCHCFTCGFKGTLMKFIGECFDENESFGKEWLLARFGRLNKEKDIKAESIKPIPNINSQKINNQYLDETILKEFLNYHPYMEKRKLTPEVINKFKIKYDPTHKQIVFPVWDEHNKLIMLTRRSVEGKYFYIDEYKEKPVYLLNHIINNNIKSVYVCESQINTLTLYGWGYNAIGLFGTGTSHQYNILKKTEINHYILCLDRDEAGCKGTIKFIKNLSKYAFIDVVEIPKGKDVNDLTKEEFEKLNIIDSEEWLRNNQITV